MKRALFLATSLTMMTGVASAGTYLGFGIGPAAAVSADSHTFDASGRSWRALVGFRFGHLSLEGGLTEYGLVSPGATKTANAAFDVSQLSATAKYSVPLSAGFEAFGRGGIQRTGITNSSGAHDVSGKGLLLGAGVEYRLNLALTDASIFLDYTYSKANVDGTRDSYGYATRMWTLGLTVGI